MNMNNEDMNSITSIPNVIYAINHPNEESSSYKWKCIAGALKDIRDTAHLRCGLCIKYEYECDKCSYGKCLGKNRLDFGGDLLAFANSIDKAIKAAEKISRDVLAVKGK
jgi:hypothetical protein